MENELLELTDLEGRTIYIRPAHIAAVHVVSSGATAVDVVLGGGAQSWTFQLTIKETPPEVAHKISQWNRSKRTETSHDET